MNRIADVFPFDRIARLNSNLRGYETGRHIEHLDTTVAGAEASAVVPVKPVRARLAGLDAAAKKSTIRTVRRRVLEGSNRWP
jgi:hypothetical protein